MITAIVQDMTHVNDKINCSVAYSDDSREIITVNAASVESDTDITDEIVRRLKIKNAIVSANTLIVGQEITLDAPIAVSVETDDVKAYKLESAYIINEVGAEIIKNPSVTRAELVTIITASRISDGITTLFDLESFLTFKGLGA